MLDAKLETFLMVAHMKNYSKAANILNLTQPAISNHVKMLEEYYGTKLLQKNNNIMELTAAGKILYKYALEMDRLSKLAREHVSNEVAVVRRYNVGATLTIGGYVLPRIMGAYKMSNTNIDIILQVENTKVILQKLYSGEIDFGVIEGPFDRTRVLSEKFRDDELILVVPSSHKFARRESVGLAEVLAEKMLYREKGSGTREIFENYLEEKGYKLQYCSPYMEIGDISAIISLVESGLGITIVSREAVKAVCKTGRIKEIALVEGKIMREFNFIYLKNADMEFINKFSVFCRNFADEN